ncbi:hypothetical protein DCS_07473 [Drechmeria coniospora]|uniref:FAR1 domain-containing protein n=1 Tax=Drechmeria coniospora TaxID=98403 RepID=A0A151GEI4_DRECN|nr:hypothetical protein DCS_07473 [Drechmeria coniospora]KYK55510.1 hypothetical protein DCS_07473 [Drechmeria coniospora]ODA81882.1 hypothetical protein RJ55_00387 [Drechmeria coniospora]
MDLASILNNAHGNASDAGIDRASGGPLKATERRTESAEREPEKESEREGDEATVIPPPPPSSVFDTYEEMYSFLQTFHRDNGAAIVKRSTGGKKHDFGNGKQYSYIVFICDRGERRPSKSVGIRKVASQRIGCSYSIVASATKQMSWKWTYRITNGHHNHGPSVDPSAHSIHRRRTSEQKELQKHIADSGSTSAREMDQIVRHQSEQTQRYFRTKDTYNDRQRMRLEKLHASSEEACRK